MDHELNEDDICHQIKHKKMKKKIRDNDIQSEALSTDDLFQIRLELQSKVLKQMIAKVDSPGIEIDNPKSKVKTKKISPNDV
ncbi:MAG: hypothetical protein A2W85_13800 [Bacteroidetes bacterium GWF2_41_31]|nr:MAG: hypothetical protein A2W85_13800 [Bacteroidetes bacterium GWF2_41_31]